MDRASECRPEIMLSPHRATSDPEMGKELCRICFIRRPTYINVFETSVTKSMTIADIFMLYLGENMYPDDDLPEFICCDCIEEVMDTKNINEACKTVVKHLVWCKRLLQIESIWKNRSITKTTSMVSLQNFFSEDNKYTEKEIREEHESDSFVLSSKFGTKSSNPSDNCKKNLRIRMIPEINHKNCLESSLHECSVCRGIFLTSEDLISHEELFHEVCSGFPCGKCHKNFKTLKSLERHLEKYSFTCKSKGAVKAEENIVNSSIKSFILSPLASITAEKVGKSEEKLKGFPKENMKYSCDKCGCSFESSKTIRVHIREIHSSVRPYLCCFCNMGFISKLELELHRYSHPKEFSCDVCKRKFYSPMFYEKHINYCQEKIIVHRCQICGKELSTKEGLKEHILTHSLVKKYECHICHMRCSSKSGILKHMRTIHLKLKPHVCGICHKSFALLSNLTSHLTTHSDERPYACSFCDKTWKTSRCLNRHRRVAHNITKTREKIIIEDNVLEKFLFQI